MSTASELPFWRPPPPTTGDLRKFGLLFSVLAAILAGFLAWRTGLEAATIPAAISAALLVVGLVLPVLLTPIWWPWMVLAKVLGFVNSHLLLAIVFYGLFMPIGLVMRIFGRDPLGDRNFPQARKAVASGGSLWQRREKTELPSQHFERQF